MSDQNKDAIVYVVLLFAALMLAAGPGRAQERRPPDEGEVSFITTKGGVLTGALDLLHVIEVSDWVTDEKALDEYIGSFGWMTRHLGRWATPLM